MGRACRDSTWYFIWATRATEHVQGQAREKKDAINLPRARQPRRGCAVPQGYAKRILPRITERKETIRPRALPGLPGPDPFPEALGSDHTCPCTCAQGAVRRWRRSRWGSRTGSDRWRRGTTRIWWPWTATHTTTSPRSGEWCSCDEAWQGIQGRTASRVALRRSAGLVGRAVRTCLGATWAKRAPTARHPTPWSSGGRMGVAPGFEREVTTMIDSVL